MVSKGIYLIQIGFEQEANAAKLARLLHATDVEPHSGYRSAFEFDAAALLSPEPQKRRTKKTIAH